MVAQSGRRGIISGILTTSVIGSHAPPSWFVAALEAIERGEFGDTDIAETLDDATRIAIQDMESAGVDIITDGEMRRVDFVLGFYDFLTGLQQQPAPRTKGPDAHDLRGKWLAVERVTAPHGLGCVAEYLFARAHTQRPLKVPVPGPYTLAGRILPGEAYADREDVARHCAELIHQELLDLVAAGARFIQLDEPSAAVYPDRPELFVELLNQVVDGIDAKLGLHLCFGNFRGRAVGKRMYAPLFPRILDVNVHQLALEFASREMVEIELAAEVHAAGKELAAGLVDVKNIYCETADDVAERIRTTLRHMPADKLHITPDCGLSQTVRWAAVKKLQAMVAGTRLVREELQG